MFPKNGETVPELRFEGFADAWEQHKLEALASFSKGVVTQKRSGNFREANYSLWSLIYKL